MRRFLTVAALILNNVKRLQKMLESEDWQRAYRDPQLVKRRLHAHRRKLQRLGVLAWPRDIQLLDIACGAGEALRILHAEGFTHLSGVDIAIDSDLKKEPWVELKVGDGRALPYPDQSFEAALCMHSLHHLGGNEGISVALREALRILKPGGYLALMDHYNASQIWLAFWCIRQKWLTWPTSGLRSFHQQHLEEWPYLSAYIRAFEQTRAIIDNLSCAPIVDSKGLFFFYWTGRKR